MDFEEFETPMITAEWGLEDPDPRSPDAAAIVERAAWRDQGEEIEAEFSSAVGNSAYFRPIDRKAEWKNLLRKAYAEAERDGVNVKARQAVEAYLKAAKKAFADAAHGDDELLPNTDWRIRAARRHEDRVVAAMLYREAAHEIEAEAKKMAEEYAADREFYEQEEAAQKREIIKKYKQDKAKERPGRYVRYGNIGGVLLKEAAEILKRYDNPRSTKTIQRWDKGQGTPPGYPGRANKTQFEMWARTCWGEARLGQAMQSLPYKETATEASNMKLTGRKNPRGLF